MIPLPVLLLSLIAGGVVNRIADTAPRRSIEASRAEAVGGAASRQSRHAPPLPAVKGSAQHSVQQQQPARHIWRVGLVYLSAIALGGLAQSQSGWSLQTLLSAVEAWFFLAVLVIDLEHHLVLNRMIGPALPIFFAANLLVGTAPLHALLLGGLVGFGLFLLIALIVPGAMGMGDVKLAGVIGATVGLSGVVTALYCGILLGGMAAIVLLIKNRLQSGVRMAYAPYLVVGTWFVLFRGPGLLHFYLLQLVQ